MTQTKLLVIANDNHMSTTQRTEFTTRVQAIADKVGAELLLLEPGQRADLFDVCVTLGKVTPDEAKAAVRGAAKSTDKADHVLSVDEQGRARELSSEARAAMVLVGGLINAGHVALMPDACLPGQKILRLARRVLNDISAPIEVTQGEVLSFSLDPLEQAIESTARVMRGELERMAEISRPLSGDIPSSTLYSRLGAHMEQLLAEQLKRVRTNE
jgi:hypothetical protein